MRNFLDRRPPPASVLKAADCADQIINLACQQFEISREEITSPSRRERIVKPRQMAMRLIRLRTDLTLEEIARLFSKEDHGTVIYACQKTDDNIKTDPLLRAAFDKLQVAVASLSRPSP